MKLQSEEAKRELTRRLRRIEGQMRGIQGMIDGDRDCREIVQQLNAGAAAMRNASRYFMRAYAKECLMGGETLDRLQAQGVVDELMDLMAQVK
jgi:DNA-binding FrmR family transcriptional regulator